MSPLNRPTVSSRELRAALETAGPHIENFNENLDAMSSDIRAIEKYFTDSGIRIRATVECGTYKPDPGVRVEEQLEWGPVEESDGPWRLLYVEVRAELNEEISEFNAPEEILRKPLIETPVETRISAYPSLPKLVSCLGQLVTVKRTPTPTITDDDIPF